MKIKLRYIALALLLVVTAPALRKAVEYAGQVKATYDAGKQVQEATKIMLANSLPVSGAHGF